MRIGKYSYRLKQIDHNGNFVYNQAIEATVGITPNTVFLDNNYPNPFNPSTKISFVLGTTGRATLKVFNLLGQEVATLADGEFNGGDTQTFTFDASKFSSGIYYYQLKNSQRDSNKKNDAAEVKHFSCGTTISLRQPRRHFFWQSPY